MADRESLPTMVGVFRDQASAEMAVDRLARAGFGGADIGLLAPGEAEEPDTLKAQATGVATGGVLGGVTGVILGAATAGAIPGIGPVLAAGAVVPMIVLAATGSAAGATMGSLFVAAGTQDQGLHYKQEVRSGRALVTVTSDRTEDALAVLEAAGALEVADVGRSDTADKLAEGEERQ